MWKIKVACLNAISEFGSKCSDITIPILLKILKEQSTNKQLVAETLLKLGEDGEKNIISILKTSDESDYSIATPI